MMKRLLVAFPGSEGFAAELADATGCEIAMVEWHRFPDGESNIRFESDVAGCSLGVVCTLDRPDEKILRLIFCAATARDLGAGRVGLVAPYLAYMRQDRRFRDGEGVTAHYFPKTLSQWFDWLVTADPHLHRIHSLSEVYPIPSQMVRCAGSIGRWIGEKVDRPLVIGPDEESAQWANAIARKAGAPDVVLRKERRGDRTVEISFPDFGGWSDRQPVLVDDIISTGQSMIQTVRGLQSAGFPPPWCVAVHAIFARDSGKDLLDAGIAGLATCNTISHPTNQIDVTDLFRDPVLELM